MTLEQKLTPQEEFQRHLQDWKEQTKDLNMREDCITHPAYHHIVAMGEKALPYIREVARQQPTERIDEDWFPWSTVVKAIAGPAFNPPPHWTNNYTDAERYTIGWLDGKFLKTHAPSVKIHFDPKVPPEEQQKFLDEIEQILKEEGADDISIQKLIRELP
jgi:glutathione peroxidase-family protein